MRTLLNAMTDMTRRPFGNTARCLRAAFFMGASAAVASFAFASGLTGDSTTVLAQAPIAVAPQANTKAPGPATPQPLAKPLWTELTPAQQQALAPLANEWDQLDAFRKGKWLAIGNKFPGIKPDEQQRVQERMRDWISLTPEQRRMARESYARAKKLNSDQKSAHWEQYQQLPEEQKKKLAAGAAAKKPVAALPPATAQGKSPIPPIKSAPKPVLERSVTPQVTNQSALQPSPQPTK